MKRVTILVDTVCGGVPVAAGTEIECTDTDAQLLITMKRAEEVQSAAPLEPVKGGKKPANKAVSGADLSNRAEGV